MHQSDQHAEDAEDVLEHAHSSPVPIGHMHTNLLSIATSAENRAYFQLVGSVMFFILGTMFGLIALNSAY